VLAAPESDQVSYGTAEFIAAEEMSRMRGYWWAPDGSALLVARVDETPVRRWYIADPARPERPATEVAYPAAGTPNAYVGLIILGVDGGRISVAWDRGLFPYVVTAHWDRRGPLVVVQTRDQRMTHLLQVDPTSGETTLIREDHDAVWLDIVPGVPTRTGAGDLVWTATDPETDTRRLVIGDDQVTPPGLQVRSVLDVDGASVLFTASEDDPAEVHVYGYEPDGGVERLTSEPGVYSGRRSAGVTLLTGSRWDRLGSATWLGDIEITSNAEIPVIEPRVELLRAGPREVRTAVVLPAGWEPGTGKLPVLMDPYGGPHAQRVLAARRAYLTSQWFAEQGFAVVVVDGRGTPGKGPEFERAVHGDLAAPVLDDQVAALQALGKEHPDLDLDRVGIRGWSFGGYLAALAVLRRPDVFHAALAGAPVTDWTLYDTRRQFHPPRSSCLGPSIPRETDPAAAARARSGRRQRGGRAHAAPVVGAAGRGAAAQRAAAVGGHAHDAAGGGGGEPAAPAGGLPEEVPRSRGCRLWHAVRPDAPGGSGRGTAAT
jgi:dipeptidyl-peptidase-4